MELDKSMQALCIDTDQLIIEEDSSLAWSIKNRSSELKLYFMHYRDLVSISQGLISCPQTFQPLNNLLQIIKLVEANENGGRN